jgi:hypothetical protein
LRTSDWDRPNCRAILNGETPALKAARTVQLPLRQRQRNSFHPPLAWDLIRFGRFPAPSLLLSERYREQSVEILILKPLNYAGQIFRENKPYRGSRCSGVSGCWC